MLYKPHQKQVEAHADDHDRRVLLWGRQVGKTYWSVNEAWIKAVQKQGRYLIVFPTYAQAKNTVWAQYLHLIPKELIAKVDNTELIITLKHLKGPMALPGKGWQAIIHDPDLPASTIELKGSDEADRLRGQKANGIIFDEYAIQKAENWKTVFEPMFSTTNGWAAFISTPKGFNHFYKMVSDIETGRSDERWSLSKATWRDNPAIDASYIEGIRKEAVATGDMPAFLQEYELEFRSVEGSVFPEFKNDIHVVKPDDVPIHGQNWITFDFGWADDHPTAINFIRITNDQVWYVHDEIHVTKTPLEDSVELLVQHAAGMKIQGVVADSARPDLIDILRQRLQPRGINVIEAPKRPNSVPTGIQLLGQMIRPRLQLIGLPRPSFYIANNCEETIKNFESYRYPSKKEDRKTTEIPIKKDDDHIDGIRYLALYLKYGTVKEEKIRLKNPFQGEYGI